MRFKYSKPSIDISTEYTGLAKIDKSIRDGQYKAADYLKQEPLRSNCLLCTQALVQADIFSHRSLDYFLCNQCHHIQSKYLPTSLYPTDTPDGLSFLDVYPELTTEQFQSRQSRIYQPKFNWILESLLEYGFTIDEIQQKSWLELGSGAGYFLACLKDFSVKQFNGLEKNEDLCGIANRYLQSHHAHPHTTSLASAVENWPADIYAAFFVLEHVQDAHLFFNALKASKPGTIFAFAIPMFSLSTLLETAFETHAGRNLDNALHVQLYTEDSLNYALKMAGFKVINQWLFGQDVGDLRRLLSIQLENNYPKYLSNIMDNRLSTLLDTMQASVDQAQFCDSRHIICIKESA